MHVRLVRGCRALTVILLSSVAILGSAGVADAHHIPDIGRPSAQASSGTPQLAATGTTEQVRQIVKCGKRMFAVGTFTKISRAGAIYARANAFSFLAARPYSVSSWRPHVYGTVNSIAVTNHCRDAYLGGEFTRTNKRHTSNIVEVSTTSGRVIRRFKASANKPVETVLVWRHHLLTGGHFTEIDGRSSHPYFASLALTTGRDDGYLSLHISGHYSYRNNQGRPAQANPTKIYNQQLSPDGKRLLVEGDFT
jgi:hypothetical protein